MSKSEVVMKTSGTDVAFPLSRHGQGMQSLAVLFLFQAYVNVLLKPMFHSETEALLALEEPETHLHPQATRALAANLDKMKGQKIISSHSPFFIQEIPFKNIRMLRRQGALSKIVYVRRSFTGVVPTIQEVETFCTNNPTKFSFHTGTSTLSVNGKVEEREYRDLLRMYPRQPQVHATLKKLHDESQIYLSDEDLANLETFAKRIRGEIFFARVWLLCEGQCEYLLLRYFAELLGKPMDRAGVAVIDFQNNGSAGAFVGLARAFEVPWVMLCDNDEQGNDFITQVKNCGVTAEECNKLVRLLPEDGMTLERFLVRNGFAGEYEAILRERGVFLASAEGEPGFEDEMVSKIKGDKTGYVNALIMKLRMLGADGSRVPELFGDVIEYAIERAKT